MMEASPDEVAAAWAYQDLHAPALFQQWAPLVADVADILAGEQVLDVACGTGVLAREVAARVGEQGSVAGLDAGAGMLAVASSLAPDIDWRQGLAESLPYEAETFDAVVSQFGLMFFRDRSAAVQEMIRVLRRGGRLAVAVWESLERSEAYPEEVELLERIAGQPAADALRAPFALGDRQKLSALFDGAGLASTEVQTRAGKARFPSVRTMVEADLRGWLPVMGVFLKEETIEEVLEASEKALGRYVTPIGTVEFDCPAHILRGVKA